ncbi:hypothetical protein H5119_09140 [Pseudoalteromonas sp. SG45-5]|uniref:hypothetical protein n=1 Tax=unclassified Pseudoalteromonas TaxID=194690 RepID=UPI0015F9690A|nr:MULTISPECIES: hypothetical protein [unclassified Pseudoalteromonas]MBB1385703.1 hypothetical protein [Pseudoalteromonas sp. SG45-5]MBB1393534.1 hypothetical protein [Pseudoalteromonas sp. SG44-4]MBB1447448.1 hypothetical protein [Pseudoalteromonas sp. SG41-6]
MTKNKYLFNSLWLLLLGMSPLSFAGDECDLPAKANLETTKRYIQCLDTVIVKAKQVQNTWIMKRQYELSKIEEETGNTQVSLLFNRSITDHEKYTDSSCQLRYMLQSPNATQAAINYKLCEITLINQFTNVLKAAL